MFAANSRLCYHIAEMKLFKLIPPGDGRKGEKRPHGRRLCRLDTKKHPSRKIRSGCPEVSRRMNYFITSPRFL